MERLGSLSRGRRSDPRWLVHVCGGSSIRNLLEMTSGSFKIPLTVTSV